MDIDISQLKHQIQKNCDISDANYAGLYSVCGLLLRLRDLYKWEHDLLPWFEPEPADLLEWVDEREKRWEGITEKDFEPILVGDQACEPFDMAGINSRLRPLGLVYGAGYAIGMKPSFFLAELLDSYKLGELTIDRVHRELARDLFMTPAMRQGNQIFARTSAMLFFLWDQIYEMRPSAREALSFALNQHDLHVDAIRSSPKQLGPELQRVASFELETWVYHEVGEVHEDVFDGDLWHEIVSTYSNTPIEIFARVIKDLLADTHPEGLMGHIIRHRIKSSLGFYTSFMRPFTRILFPEARKAFDLFSSNSDWSIVEEARQLGYSKAHGQALALIDLHEAGRSRGVEWTKARIMTNLIEPLGIVATLKEEDV